MEAGRVLIGKLEHKSDLLAALEGICRQENIQFGTFSVIGAISKVSIGFYNQITHKYIESLRSEDHYEITSCAGNISLKDSEVFLHAHITLADDRAQCFGGHLMQGCEVFAAEYYIKEVLGEERVRQYDEITGLTLWA